MTRCTGFSEPFRVDPADRRGIDEIVIKPVLTREIAAAITRVLEK